MSTVPGPKGGFSTGTPDTSDLNSKLVDPISFLLKVPMARLRQTTLQAVATSTFTAVTFTTEDNDDDWVGNSGHSNSLNTSKWTATYPGWYQLSGAVGYAANATGRRFTAWYVNSSIVNGCQIALPATAANDAAVPARTMHVYLNVGDIVELYAYQESGGNLNTFVTTGGQSSAEIRWVRN